MYKDYRVIDCHVHFSYPIDGKKMIDVIKETDADTFNIVLVPDRQKVSSLPEALMLKNINDDKNYVFSNLDVSEYFRHNKTIGKHFKKYAQKALKMGADGIKLIEGKPQIRKALPIPAFDSEAWDEFFEFAEKNNVPILWHVNDPEENWDINKVSEFAKKSGWFYDESYINNEKQYSEVLNVLEKHPNIKICFAHFFFLSNNLDRLSEILDKYPNASIDLTPGIEMYGNLSNNKEKGLMFFEKYQDRIMYGTDICARNVLGINKEINEKESFRRSEIVKYFLTEKEEIEIESDGNFLIGMDKFILRPFNLKEDICKKIFNDNFVNFTSINPKKTNPKLIKKECNRLKIIIKVMSFIDKTIKVDYSVINEVKAYFKKLR